MNFRVAHRSCALFADPRRRLRGACVALSAVILASPCLAACGRPAGHVQVVHVDERLDIELSDGRIVRLGGLDMPNAEPGAPEIPNGAPAFLSHPPTRPPPHLLPLARRSPPP